MTSTHTLTLLTALLLAPLAALHAAEAAQTNPEVDRTYQFFRPCKDPNQPNLGCVSLDSAGHAIYPRVIQGRSGVGAGHVAL